VFAIWHADCCPKVAIRLEKGSRADFNTEDILTQSKEIDMKQNVKSYALICALSGLVAAAPALAQSVEGKVTASPARTLTPQEQQALSVAAARVVRHIADARGAIHDKDLAKAKEDLGKAKTLIEIIKETRPTTKITYHIQAAKKHLEYEDTDVVAADLIPVETELTNIEDLVPAKTAQQHLGKAQKHLSQGNKKGAKEELEAVEDALVYTEIGLPLAATDQQVSAALELLAQDKPEQADKALMIAEDGVVIISLAAETPLEHARVDLWQAGKKYAAEKYEAAKVDLKRAGEWIDQAMKSSDKAIHSEAKELKASLDELAGKLAGKK
jgi:hypothetical protein